MGLLLLCETVAKPFHEEYGFNFQADKTSKENKKVYVEFLALSSREGLITGYPLVPRKQWADCNILTGKMQAKLSVDQIWPES
jgi:poly [ADP-ribose] polymerase